MVAVVQVLVAKRAQATGAFGDVLAGHLDMDAAGMGAFGLVHAHEAAHLAKHRLEGPGLVARRGLDGVAVHRVA